MYPSHRGAVAPSATVQCAAQCERATWAPAVQCEDDTSAPSVVQCDVEDGADEATIDARGWVP